MPTAPVARLARRVLAEPAPFCGLVVALILAGLALDRGATLGQQNLLGLCTWGVLIGACVGLPIEQRSQVAVVVAVATVAEVIGSIIWRVYQYRLGNLPLFVPAGHGLVYLCGMRLSQIGPMARHPRRLVGVAVVGALAWGALGLTVLPRTDVAGALGVATLVAFLLRGRAPAVYAGVFITVAFLEIYGTWIGTWHWAAQVPGLGIGAGNPPSGAASGYVLFDICALALGPRLTALVRRAASRRPRVADADPGADPA